MKSDLINHAIKSGSIYNKEYMLDLILVSPFSNHIKEGKFDNVPIPWYEKDEALINVKDVFTLRKDSGFTSIKGDIKTTFGNMLANLIFEFSIPNKFDYINTKISLSDNVDRCITKLIAEGNNDITRKNLIDNANAVTYISQFSKYWVVSSSPKLILPPKGIENFRKNLIIKYNKEHGDKWSESYVISGRFKDELSKFDDDYMKGDPTYGIMYSGKVKNISLPKSRLTGGNEQGFIRSPKASTKIEPLIVGKPSTPRELTIENNGTRLGSYSRGVATQITGNIANIMSSATDGIGVTDTDCKTSKTINRTITIKNYKKYLFRSYLNGNRVTTITTMEQAKTLIGKKIKLRYAGDCLNKSPNLCAICTLSNAKDNPLLVSSLSTRFGGILLTGDMKAMHGKLTKVMKFDKKRFILKDI